MLPGHDGSRERNHGFQGFTAQTVESPPAAALLANQTGFLEHSQMKGNTGRANIEDLLQLARGAIPVSEQLEDAEARCVRRGIKPLRGVRQVTRQRMRQTGQGPLAYPFS